MRIKKAFTLLEILMVMGIIGILIAVSVVAFISARKTARDAKRKTDLEQVRGALELYKTDNSGNYPTIGGGNGPISDLPITTSYITTIPTDPQSTLLQYYYVHKSSPEGYYICASLENGSATVNANCNAGGVTCAVGSGSGVCNYSVTNP